MLQGCSWLVPNKFSEFQNLMVFQRQFFPVFSNFVNQKEAVLLIELKQFADQYISCIPVAITQDEKELNGERSECEEEEESLHVYCTVKKHCFQRFSCSVSVLFEISQSGLFFNLYVAYKFVVTVLCTKVTYERVFSKLKILKNWLRPTSGQELEHSSFHMQVGRDLCIS